MGFLRIGWQNYFNIMIFLLKYTYILICMWRNVRYNFFDFCLGSTAMCLLNKYNSFELVLIWYEIHFMVVFIKIPFNFPGKIIKQDLTPRPNPMGIVLKNSCIMVKVSSVHGICTSFYV